MPSPIGIGTGSAYDVQRENLALPDAHPDAYDARLGHDEGRKSCLRGKLPRRKPRRRNKNFLHLSHNLGYKEHNMNYNPETQAMVAVANAFMERIILSLLPFFIAATPDPDEARAAVVGALASYGARTQHDLTETAQILALGFSTVDSLAESTNSAMSVNKRLRLRGNAATLVRSKKTCQQALSNSRYVSDSQYPEAPEYPEIAEPSQPETTQPEPALANSHPATPNSILHRARDRGLQPESPVAETTPEPTAPSPTAPSPTAPASVSAAPLHPAPASVHTPVPQTDEQDATLWAGVMSQVAGNHGRASTHATG